MAQPTSSTTASASISASCTSLAKVRGASRARVARPSTRRRHRHRLVHVGQRAEVAGHEGLARHLEHGPDDAPVGDVAGAHLAFHHVDALLLGGRSCGHRCWVSTGAAGRAAHLSPRGAAGQRGLEALRRSPQRGRGSQRPVGPAPPLPPRKRHMIHARPAGPRGGVVTQRIANPRTPVRFRAWPPLRPGAGAAAAKRPRAQGAGQGTGPRERFLLRGATPQRPGYSAVAQW